MSQETRTSSISWRILLQSKPRNNLLPRGFMQFGALIDNASPLFWFTLFYRLCIPASYSGGRVFETGEEKIFKLNRNKGNYLKYLAQYETYRDISANNRRDHQIWPLHSRVVEARKAEGPKYFWGGWTIVQANVWPQIRKGRRESGSPHTIRSGGKYVRVWRCPASIDVVQNRDLIPCNG